MKKATLVLQDGTELVGKSFGYELPVSGEVVFSTAMTGYPESLTDPSFAGQMLTLTYPLVGNYGVPPFSVEPNGIPTFMESDRIYAAALIVSDYCEKYSHWNACESLADWLKREKVPGIAGIDTRELTKKLREHGVMMGRIVFDGMECDKDVEKYDEINYNRHERIRQERYLRNRYHLEPYSEPQDAPHGTQGVAFSDSNGSENKQNDVNSRATEPNRHKRVRCKINYFAETCYPSSDDGMRHQELVYCQRIRNSTDSNHEQLFDYNPR